MGLAFIFGLGCVLGAPASAEPAHLVKAPPNQNPLGPLKDVTHEWQRYQPANRFCVRVNVFEVTGNTGGKHSGAKAACRRSGFGPGDGDLYLVEIETPRLCAGCHRLFLDYSRIPRRNRPPSYWAHGHAYFRLDSPNFTYTADPLAHSPNIKNFTNDKLIAPYGSPLEQVAHAFDLHAISYVGDTAHFAHSEIQGPYYIGPWYLNRHGRRIHGAFVDIDVASAERMPDDALNEILYRSGFNSGELTCVDNASPEYRDGNYLYGGCVDNFGFSRRPINPFVLARSSRRSLFDLAGYDRLRRRDDRSLLFLRTSRI